MKNNKYKTTFALPHRETLLPEKIANILSDIVGILLLSLALVLSVALVSYNIDDNIWSKTNDYPNSLIHNKLGIVGAYLADILFYIFGNSAWWLIIGLLYLGFRRLSRTKILAGKWYCGLKIIAFILLVLASTMLEQIIVLQNNKLYFFNNQLGQLIYAQSIMWIGQYPLLLLCLIIIIATFSITFIISWLIIAEKIGASVFYIMNKFQRLLQLIFSSSQNKALPSSTINSNVNSNSYNSLEYLDSLTDRVYSDSTTNSVTEKLDQPWSRQKNLIKSTNLSKKNILPSTFLLSTPEAQLDSINTETIAYISRAIVDKLAEFGIEATINNTESGPVITRYELLPASGVRGDKIVNLSKDIARSLALNSIRIVETLSGKNSMGVEVPNFKRQIIHLKEILDSSIYQNSNDILPLALGKDIAGNIILADLTKMPHLLIAGTTGSGKSVAINSMIISILFKASYEQVKFIMIDPKVVELSLYQDIPHLLTPVITEMNQAVNALKWAIAEMERRYNLMAKLGSKNIYSLNQKIKANKSNNTVNNSATLNPWFYIVIIIDELADLMMVGGKIVEQYIIRIAQKARAVGIHLIIATQRPSVDVITGLIKANIPTRIAFQVASKIDSRIILDQMGAESLLGQGDMLYLPSGSGFSQRAHGAYIDDDELDKIVLYLKSLNPPNYIIPELKMQNENIADLNFTSINNEVEQDEIFNQVVNFINESKHCTISSLQTRFEIGYNRATKLLTQLEKIGMIKRGERGNFELVK